MCKAEWIVSGSGRWACPLRNFTFWPVTNERFDLVVTIRTLSYRRLAGFSAGSHFHPKMNDESKQFVCIFCHHRSDQRHLGCPRCGRLYGYGEAKAMKSITLASGLVFTAIGLFLIFLALRIVFNELHLPYEMAPWWVFVVMFGLGGLFAVGGLTSLMGNCWLLRLLLLLFVRNVPVANRHQD